MKLGPSRISKLTSGAAAGGSVVHCCKSILGDLLEVGELHFILLGEHGNLNGIAARLPVKEPA